MEWLNKMNSSLDYIEANITERLDYLQASNIACCSPSRFQKYVYYPRISFQIKIIGGHFAIDKVKHVLEMHFGIKPNNIVEVYGGISAKNYKVTSKSESLFFKVYDKKKIQTHLWTKNIDCYMPILVWLNENTDLKGRIAHPWKTTKGNYCFEDDENVFLLFDYIEGETAGKSLTHFQIIEAAEILACLHNAGNSIPFKIDRIKEDFSVPFCYSLDKFIAEDYASSPPYIKEILQPCLQPLIAKNNAVKSLSEKYMQKNIDMTLCHMDAHGYNLMQSERLVLVDWEMAKYAPPELDLCVYTKPEYWDTFIEHYNKLRPNFVLDNDLLIFYVHRRNIDDIWAFIESILHDNQSDGERQLELDLLSACCRSLGDAFYKL